MGAEPACVEHTRRLEAAVDSISQGLAMFDADRRLVISNRSFRRMYGLPDRLLVPGTPLGDILDRLFASGLEPENERDVYLAWRRELIANHQYGKAVMRLGGRAILMQHHPTADGGWVTTHEDITEQRRTEARIRHLARRDESTGLANRRCFLEEMQAGEPAIAHGQKAAVLSIDIDRFKAINDAFGHKFGDGLLKEVAARLGNMARPTDLLARVGADEFSLLVRPLEGARQAAEIAGRIAEAVAEPFRLDGHQIAISASIGIAVAPEDGASTETLIKHAELARFKARKHGCGTYNFFEPGMDAALKRRRTIEAGLKRALAEGELELAFQPLVSLESNRVSCFETLLRWTHPEEGPIPPSEFIAVAEETGLIVRIGAWALEAACRRAAEWPADVRVAVNLSPVQFRQEALTETVAAALEQSRLGPDRLELEITESLLLESSDEVLATLHRLRESGVHIAMDDFGIGYSSLSYLRSFPFDKIKIDRSFMADVEVRPDSRAIIKAVVGLSHSLGMSTAAEGIETEGQLRAVLAEGCDEAQGFLFSPPLAPKAAEHLLETTRRGFPRLRTAADARVGAAVRLGRRRA